MDSKDIKEIFGDWHKITMPSDVRRSIDEHLQKSFEREKRKRRGPWIKTTSSAILFSVAAIFISVITLKTVHDRPTNTTSAFTNSETPVPMGNQNEAFQPPKDLVNAYHESAANGALFISGYCTKQMLNTQTTTDYFREASEAYVVVKKSDGKQIVVDKLMSPKPSTTVHKPLWFSADGVWYAVIDNEYEGNHISVYQFTPSNSDLGWDIKVVFKKTFQADQLPYKSGNRLLIRSESIGPLEQLYCSFTRSGLQFEPVSEQWPKPGSIPNSVTLTLHESVSRDNGKTVATLTGDSSPLQMKIGQTLILRIVGDTSVPVYSMYYADYGDPGDGSLATRLASPYTNTMLFKMVTPAKHGSVIFSGVNDVVKGVSKITIVVQSGE